MFSQSGFLLEFVIAASGVYLWIRARAPSSGGLLWRRPDRIPRWTIALPDFLIVMLFVILAILFGSQAILRLAGFGGSLKTSDQLRLALISGAAFHFPNLAIWPLLRAYFPPARTPSSGISWREAGAFALRGFLLVMPVLILVSIFWQFVLEWGRITPEPQDLVKLYQNGGPAIEIIGLTFLTVVVAPISEELIFRGAIFGFLRTRLPDNTAITISSVLFALLHYNWLSFLPLATLGWFLCLVYAKSGSLKTSMMLHALFNANTLIYIYLTGSA